MCRQEEADKIRAEYIVEPTAALAVAIAEYQEAEAALERVASGAEAGTSAAAAEDSRAGKSKRAGGAAAAEAAVDDKLAAAGLAAQSWWLEAVDMLVVHSGDGGAAAARHIKAQLGDLDSCALTGCLNTTRHGRKPPCLT